MSSLFNILERIASERVKSPCHSRTADIDIVRVAIGPSLESEAVVYASIITGLVVIISAFLMIIKQYERAIIYSAAGQVHQR
jgi:hypothetical protein